ncbi:MAG: Rid family hydrolase, partial [Gemmatimonadota bacterium]
DMDDYGAVNEIYGEHFEDPYPARSAVEAATLPRNARVEIELVARAAG